MFSRHQRSSAMHYSQMTTGDYNFSRNILIKGLSIPLAGPMLGRHFTTNASKALKLQVLSNMRSNKPCRGFVFHHSSKTCSLGTFQRAGPPGLSIDLYQPRPSCLGRKAIEQKGQAIILELEALSDEKQQFRAKNSHATKGLPLEP